MSIGELIERLEKATDIDEPLGNDICAIFVDRDDYPNIAHRIMRAAAYADTEQAIKLVELMLRPAHPGMTMKLDIRWSGSDHYVFGEDRYVFAEITWPSTERQGRAHTPARAIMAALLLAVDETERQLAPFKTSGPKGKRARAAQGGTPASAEREE